MTEQAAAEKKKRTVRPDAIVATITIALPVDKKAADFFANGAAVARLAQIAAAEFDSNPDVPDGLIVSVEGPKLGKMP